MNKKNTSNNDLSFAAQHLSGQPTVEHRYSLSQSHPRLQKSKYKRHAKESRFLKMYGRYLDHCRYFVSHAYEYLPYYCRDVLLSHDYHSNLAECSKSSCESNDSSHVPVVSGEGSGTGTSTTFIVSWVAIGTLLALVLFCLGILIYEMVKIRRNHRLDGATRAQATGTAPQGQFSNRTLQDGPLPYVQDLNPPKYVDLFLNEEDLPSYDEATLQINDAVN